MIVFYLVLGLMAGAGGGLRNYQCKKCGTLVRIKGGIKGTESGIKGTESRGQELSYGMG